MRLSVTRVETYASDGQFVHMAVKQPQPARTATNTIIGTYESERWSLAEALRGFLDTPECRPVVDSLM